MRSRSFPKANRGASQANITEGVENSHGGGKAARSRNFTTEKVRFIFWELLLPVRSAYRAILASRLRPKHLEGREP